ELARDDEACERGVEGSDLAAALVEAARMGDRDRGRALVGLVEDGSAAFRDRVVRLLDRPAGPRPHRRPRGGWALVPRVLVIAVVAGLVFGEEIVANLPVLIR